MNPPKHLTFIGSVAALLLLAAVPTTSVAQKPMAAPSHEVSSETVERWMSELSNWGRWGPNDRLGALNLVTDATRRAAIKLVRDGVPVSLSHNFAPDAKNDAASPFMHQMYALGSPGPFAMDRYAFSFHGPDQSHFDALCHMVHLGKMYNGVPQTEVTAQGCNQLSVTDVKSGMAVRAVLIDIPRLKGVAYLAPGTPIYTEDLVAWERKAGVKVQPGDLVLIRTGRWALPSQANSARTGAGLHVSTMPWIKSRDVALMGSDYATDVAPSLVPGNTLPDHQLLLVAMGVRIFDNLDLEAVAAEAAKRHRWTFLVVAAPLAVDGGTGSPINPVAYF